MNDAAAIFIAAVKPKIVEQFTIPARAERRAPAPAKFSDGPTGRWLRTMLGGHKEPWLNQARALDHIAEGKNVVIATAPASGKTLVFQAAVVHELLTGSGTALVFYPQKALASDQMIRWQESLVLAGLERTLVGEINGDVPFAEREWVLGQARVVLATPDVIHSWMMRQISAPHVQRFLAALQYVVIDEAHMFEGDFGSRFAFLMRRLRAAQRSAV